ncbi:fumarylacetoacetate hydrolase family protein [Salinibacterium sp. SWN248]|uniref:fumarylacetoacetate hydrolase family protein n=1 Tax=Salinibacterium sp. SWN248 TaxID=2792056 RepID=UPI0018CE094E|nr:fumarylacetoacetate hydrolase family protein [Salinibacterium sp. SWN248]MBH0024326.1 fumarylacetoacetate hydrolase family protein [Salinibacterium sp. SWN248]
MRLAVIDGRASLLVDGTVVDIERASAGRFSATVDELYRDWAPFQAWEADAVASDRSESELEPAQWGALAHAPQQIFAVGLNYVDHAAESGFNVPEHPMVFTKFASSISGPFEPLVLPTDSVDWEVELVAVVGSGGRNIAEADGLAAIAGFCIGQDYSARDVQMRGVPPQFSLGKSFAGFAPLGPVFVDTESFLEQSEITLECWIDDALVQSAPMNDMVFSVPRLVSELSSIVELRPGDVIFTGTPPGVGFGQNPPRYLRAGEVVRSAITGLGTMSQECVAP